jgi:beta-lactamase class A
MHEHTHEQSPQWHAENKKLKYTIRVILCGWIITALVSVWWNLHEKKESILNEFHTKYPLIDPSRANTQKSDLVLNIQDLRVYLQNISKEASSWAETSIYFEVLNTGANAAVNPDTKIFPASLTKLPLAMVIMKQVEKKIISLDSTIELTKEDADELGTPGISKQIGQRYTVQFLLEQLLSESNNSAYRMLKRQTSEEELRGIGQSVGLETLFTQEGKLAAKDYTRLLRALFTAGFLEPEHSQTLLELMQKSDYHELLKAGIPDSIPFAHKWGTNIEFKVYADSGIVYVPNRPYMLSVMIECKNESLDFCKSNANNLTKSIAEKTLQYISNFK